MHLLILVPLAVVFVVLILLAVSRRRQELFQARFPPISDAEFLARCSPGTNPEVALKVRRIIADSFGVEYEQVYPSSRLAEDLGAD